MKVSEIAYIILSFLLISTFIAVFFFSYVSSIEAEIIKTQISTTLENFLSGMNLILTPSEKEEILRIIGNSIKVPDMSASDNQVQKVNSKLIQKSIIIFSTLIAVGFVVLGILRYNYSFELTEMLKYSLIILCLIAGTEILFVTFVTKNYRLIDPNFLTFTIVENLKAYVKNTP